MSSFHFISLLLVLVRVLASGILFYQKSKGIGTETANNLLRLRSWWFIALIVIVSLTLEFYGAVLLGGLIVCLSIYELSKMAQVQKRFLFTVAGFFFLALIISSFAPAVLLGVFLLSLSFYFLLRKKRRLPLLCLSVSLTASFLLLPALFKNHGELQLKALLLTLILLSSLNDVFQYVCGKVFGKRALAPKISPKKTIEGAFGGVLLSSLLSMLLWPGLMEVSYPKAFALGMAISMAGILGDLNISQLKRDLGCKDSGTMIPGHGGILDRVDSLSFTLPTFTCLLLGVQL